MKARFFRLLVLIYTLTVSATYKAEEPYTLLVFGDSLSAAYGIEEEQGWVTLLETKITDESWPYQVVNGSVSGETTTGGLERLPAMLNSYEPDLVVLELGGNDGLRGLPVSVMKNNLVNMVQLIQNSGAAVLLAGIQIPPNYGPRYTEPFFASFSEIANEEQIPLVPFLIDGIPQQPELMQNDGIHPKAEAQFMILENVWPHLETMLKKN